MKKIKIILIGTICLMMTSCGQMLSAISNGSVVNAITSVIGMDKVSARGLIGTWNYLGPGCAFTSENLLAKAGGEVAAAQIEEKLLPYYQQVGITSSNTYIIRPYNGYLIDTLSVSYGYGNFTLKLKRDPSNPNKIIGIDSTDNNASYYSYIS